MLAYEDDTTQTAPPEAEAALQPASAPAGTAATATTPLILLVDDEPGVLASLRRLLRPTG